MEAKVEFPSNIKRTRQREEIFKILSQASEPMSAQDIYQQLLQIIGTAGDWGEACGGSLALSTVYRALSAFEEKGYVHKSTLLGEDMSYYEWATGQHKHYAVCLSCHRLIPLKACPFEHSDGHSREQNQIQLKEEDFMMTGHRLELYGYCGSCRTKE